MTKPILILDDDVHFRNLVAGLFQARGYEVFECRTTKEASSIFAETDPGLAIVDYRLPESDGITWISWLRESGRNFPVVFCSGTWCDEKTFNWLRNILRVSLILRKPIVPELFIQQVENLLPKLPVSAPKDDFTIIPPPKPSQFVAPVTADDLKLQIEKIDVAITKSTPVSSTHNQLVAMRSKLVVQQMLAEAKQSYAQELPAQWQALAEAVALLQQEPNNKIAFDDSVMLSHRIRGTAGAMGFREAGDAAGKIEDLLRRFDPSDTLTEVLWTEIFRALADGEVAVRGLSLVVGGGKKSEPNDYVSNVLFLCRPENFEKQLAELASAKIEALVCDSIQSALSQAKAKRVDAAVFDLSAADDGQIFRLASQVRESTPGKPIGMAFISAGQNAADEVALAYAGSSSFLWSPVPPVDLVENVQLLTRLGGSGGRPKVLTVDDDDALTGFIQTILGGENIEVEALNKPIQILNVVEQFQPDLILLDVMMPGLSGYDVCRLLRATDKWAQIPILFLTSRSDADGRASAFQAGATDFLSKPILAPELVARVRAHLSQSPSQKHSGQDGLLDRKEFIETTRALIKAARSADNEVSLCLLLIDDLLNLSIVHGIAGAESVEKVLGNLLRIHFKAESIRARWGEGGFALAVPGENRSTMAEALQLLANEFASVRFSSQQQTAFHASFSAGLAGSPGDDLTIENLMNMANVRMSRGRQLKAGTIVAVGG
ncbi:MAG TPA: response regulator [Drouetiella sp.]|jgi:diguanylate cyclase (GGDEF)-like protein